VAVRHFVDIASQAARLMPCPPRLIAFHQLAHERNKRPHHSGRRSDHARPLTRRVPPGVLISAGMTCTVVIKKRRSLEPGSHQARSPFVIVWRDQVANDWRGAGNKQSGYTFLVLPVSRCDTFMLA